MNTKNGQTRDFQEDEEKTTRSAGTAPGGPSESFSPLPGTQPKSETAGNDTAAEFSEGDVIEEQFEVIRLLGRGGMGIVYLVVDRLTGQQLALKVILPSLLTTSEAASHFVQEVNIGRRLRHPGIAAIYDVRRSGPVLFCTMEYVEGLTLREYMHTNGRLSLEKTVQLLSQVCKTLAYAHEFAVHRDISPTNIMITPAGEVRLLDFGISKPLGMKSSDVQETPMGKAQYLAPEQYKASDEVDARADIYSLGVLLFEMLAGDLPSAYHPLAEIRPDLPQSCQDLVTRSLGPREKRPPSAHAFDKELRALCPWLEEKNITTVDSSPRTRVKEASGQDSELSKDRNAEKDVLRDGEFPETRETAAFSPKARRRAAMVLVLLFMVLIPIPVSYLLSQISKKDDRTAQQPASAVPATVTQDIADSQPEQEVTPMPASSEEFVPLSQILQARKLQKSTVPGAQESPEPAFPGDEPEIPSWKHVWWTMSDFSGGTARSIGLGDGVSLEVVWVPPGRFFMGSGRNDESPINAVRFEQGFWLGKHEVTKAQWEALMGTEPWSTEKNVSDNPNSPAVYVSWVDVDVFCTALSEKTGRTIRLPTEAEWEYACCAGISDGDYCYGDAVSRLRDYATYGQDGPAAAIGSNLPNAWGLYDMHGNVWEWCQDIYRTDAYSRKPGVFEQGDAGKAETVRVIRGGSWRNDGPACRSANRESAPATERNGYTGFRVVCSDADWE